MKKERSARLRALSDAACRAHWHAKLGREDVVLVDRPGRGYGDDYSPWLVDAPVGELVRVRGARRHGGGDRRRLQPTASSAGSCARATTSRRRTASSPIRDINPQAETHLLVLPERHVDTFREVARVSARRGEADARRSWPRRRDKPGLEDYRVVVNVGPGGGQTIFHLHWHVLGGRIGGMPAMSLIARIEESCRRRCARATTSAATRFA